MVCAIKIFEVMQKRTETPCAFLKLIIRLPSPLICNIRQWEGLFAGDGPEGELAHIVVAKSAGCRPIRCIRSSPTVGCWAVISQGIRRSPSRWLFFFLTLPFRVLMVNNFTGFWASLLSDLRATGRFFSFFCDYRAAGGGSRAIQPAFFV